MIKINKIIPIILVLGVGVVKSEPSAQDIFDQEFMAPLINLVKKDAAIKLTTLYKQRVYLVKKIEQDRPLVTELESKRQALHADVSRLQEEKNYWINQGRALFGDNSLDQQLTEREKKIQQINDELYPYRRQEKILTDDLDFRIGILENQKNHPLNAIFNFFKLSNSNLDRLLSLYSISDETREKNLQKAEDDYNDVLTRTQNAEPEEYVQHHLAGQYGFADDAYNIRMVLLDTMAVLGAKLSKKREDIPYRDLSYAFSTYMQDVINNPEKTENRIYQLNKRSGTFYSFQEPSLQLSHIVPTWLSNGWQAIKNGWQAIKDYAMRERPGFERSLQRIAPEHTGRGKEYEIERALEAGQDFSQPLPRPHYGVYERFIQPRVERFQQKLQQSPSLRNKVVPPTKAERAFERMQEAGGYY